ncbi:MAG: Ig-like domain-containing protein, partial [Leptospiraceae bacterium]|nr:Ig-like domain-containing protein [Leptospiraceae bacterium]
ILVFITITGCDYLAKEGIPSNLKLFLGIPDRTPPKVNSTLPKDKSTNNFRNTGVFVVFNIEMDLNSAKSNIILTTKASPTAIIDADYTIEEKVVSIVPKDNLPSNTTFNITVKKEVSSRFGISLGTEYKSEFTTGTEIDKTPPSVASSSPIDGTTGYPINATVSVTFNEEINPATMKDSTFTLNSGAIKGSISILNSTVAFNPDENLPKETVVIARINSGVKDLAGNVMASPYVWSFTTGSTTASDCTFGSSLIGSCLLK